MKFKKCMRCIPVFLLLFSVLVVPVAASESYSFAFDGGQASTCSSVITEGSYNFTFTYGELYYVSSIPVEVKFAELDYEELHIDVGWFGEVPFVIDGNSVNVPVLIVVDYEQSCSLLYSDMSLDGVLTLTSYNSKIPSISYFIGHDTLNGLLIEVVSVLPIVLSVVVLFIAIRKGISFLKAILFQA